ncbi:MAG: 4'-phosphopantetheinyl transferase superfamily protein [Pseudacidovorax sp.]|nr:4'-phosphopantetheinyl transferase superfamily protein [Pseudacidovorax sp.]
MHLLRLPAGCPAAIEVHRLDIDTRVGGAAVTRLLTQPERERTRRLHRADDRARFAQTRAALRCLLAARLHCAPLEVPIAVDARGKPFLANVGGAPLFNVSHSGRHALIAMAAPGCVGQLGVDIEQCRTHDDLPALVDLVFSPREIEALRSEDDAVRGFHLRWTGKEAVLKAIGLGIADHLRSVGIHPGADGRLEVDCTIPGWQDRGLQAIVLDSPSGHAAALAWSPATKGP